METSFYDLPMSINLVFIVVTLFIVIRAAHYLVDGAVNIAHEFRISPLIIGASVVAMGTTSAENAVNLVVVLGKGDTSTVIGNILGSNLINVGIELGVSALIAGIIIVPREAIDRNIPLYLAGTGFMTALVMDGQINRVEAIAMISLFIAAMVLIIQYARAKSRGSVLLVEVTEIEAISHPTALELTRHQALIALFGGLVVLVIASRLLILNTAAVAHTLHVPEFMVGLLIIGPGTSLPEISSSIQAARQGHAGLVLGTAFGSCFFNLSLGLGLPALIRPLVVGDTASQSFIYLNAVNISLMILLLLDLELLGKAGTINRVIGGYLVVMYLGFITFQVLRTGGASTQISLTGSVAAAMVVAGALVGWRRRCARAVSKNGICGPVTGGTFLCATRGGQESQITHQKAIALAQEHNAELIFLYVFDQRILEKVATPIVINVEAQMRHMRVYLQNTAQEQAQHAGVPARVIIRAGGLREQIISVAKEERVERIILGRPAGEITPLARESLNIFISEIEEATGLSIAIPSEQDATHEEAGLVT